MKKAIAAAALVLMTLAAPANAVMWITSSADPFTDERRYLMSSRTVDEKLIFVFRCANGSLTEALISTAYWNAVSDDYPITLDMRLNRGEVMQVDFVTARDGFDLIPVDPVGFAKTVFAADVVAVRNGDKWAGQVSMLLKDEKFREFEAACFG